MNIKIKFVKNNDLFPCESQKFMIGCFINKNSKKNSKTNTHKLGAVHKLTLVSRGGGGVRKNLTKSHQGGGGGSKKI